MSNTAVILADMGILVVIFMAVWTRWPSCIRVNAAAPDSDSGGLITVVVPGM